MDEHEIAELANIASLITQKAQELERRAKEEYRLTLAGQLSYLSAASRLHKLADDLRL